MEELTLTPEQQTAANKIHAWWKSRDKWFFCLKGYAGTGKTTLMRYLVEHMFNSECMCCAPTGKAASVLQGKIATIKVRTIHGLLYRVKPKGADLQEKLMEAKLAYEKDPENRPKRDLVFELQRAIEQPSFDYNENNDLLPGMVVIIDESSMVTEKMANDFKNTNALCLFVGDPGQLPPVGSDHWFEDQEADAMLETIQRQALDNPIIALSMAVRNNLDFPPESDQLKYLKRGQMSFDEYEDVDQVICGTNKTRESLNRWFRSNLGFDKELPQKGDKLICLRNNFQEGWINGVQCTALSDTTFDPYTEDPVIDLLYNNRHIVNTPYYPVCCQQHYKNDIEHWPYEIRQEIFNLDYAYAITCHKSQGSEWNKVVIADDQMQAKNKLFRKRWLYTAITRAKESLIWIK